MKDKINIRVDGREVTVYLDQVILELEGKKIPVEIVDEYGEYVQESAPLWANVQKYLDKLSTV